MSGINFTNNPGRIETGDSIQAKWSKGTVKKEDSSVNVEELKKSLAKDGKDNIVVQDDRGNLYTITSDEINYKNGKLPNSETNINFVQVNEGLRVVDIDGKKKSEVVKNTSINGKIIYSDNEEGKATNRKVKLNEDFIRTGEEGVYQKPVASGYPTAIYIPQSDRKAVAKLNDSDCRIESNEKSLEEITDSMKNNGKDDVVVQDKNGNFYTFSSKNIDYSKDKMPEQQSTVNFTIDNEKYIHHMAENGKDPYSTKVYDTVVGKIVYSDNDVTDGFSLRHPNSKQNPLVREVKSNVKDNDLYSALRESKIPSLVLKTGDGKRFIFYSDKLPEKLPELFKVLKIAGVHGFVSYINNPKNISKEKDVSHFDKIEIISFNNEKTKAMNKKMAF